MTAAMQEAAPPAPNDPALRGFAAALVRTAAWCGAAIIVVGLFGRIMTAPLGHDEQIHVAAARLLFREPLYGALGYNHLPGLPLLLGGLYAVTGTDHLLLTGRLLIFLCWIASASVLWLIARYHVGGDRVGITVILVSMAGALLGPTGTLVTNNFLPLPFAMFGIHLFILSFDFRLRAPGLLIGAGAAIGFAVIVKISYVFLVPPIAAAAILAPLGITPARRLRRVILPLVAGGLLGALPGLIPLVSGPRTLFAHTVRYFVGGHLAYWQHSTDAKAMSLGAKMLVANDVWFAGSGLIALLLAGTAAWMLAQSGPRKLLWWPIPLVTAVIALGCIVSFAPTPAFPQYYEPPVPFILILFVILYRQLDGAARAPMRALLCAAGVLAGAILLPRLLSTVPAALQPARWTGNVVHAEGQTIREILGHRGMHEKIATLAPITALEGGYPIYREFAAGPFVYRVADYLSPSDRSFFTTTSASELASFLDAHPPIAIVTGREPALDQAFINYALSRGYARIDLGDAPTSVFMRPVDERASPVAPAPVGLGI